MRLKPLKFGVTFVYRLQNLWAEKGNGWEKTKPSKVGNNLPLTDMKVKKERRQWGSCSQNLYEFYLLLPCVNLGERYRVAIRRCYSNKAKEGYIDMISSLSGPKAKQTS